MESSESDPAMKRSPSGLNMSEFGQIYASVIGLTSEYEAASPPVRAEFRRIGRLFRDDKTKAVEGFPRSKNGYPTTALTGSWETMVQYEAKSRGSVVSSKTSGGLETDQYGYSHKSGGTYTMNVSIEFLAVVAIRLVPSALLEGIMIWGRAFANVTHH